MKVFGSGNCTYHSRKPVTYEDILPEQAKLANVLQMLVNKNGQSIYMDSKAFVAAVEKSNVLDIDDLYINMISTIIPQIKMLISKDLFIDDDTFVEQVYCILLRNGYSRNTISGALYAVFSSLNKTLKLSDIELKELDGDDVFSFQPEQYVVANDDNIEKIEELVNQGDNNAKVALGSAILYSKTQKYIQRDKANNVFDEKRAVRLLEEGLNHGSGKAAQMLGDYKFARAKSFPVSNDYYSRAYEYYTIYGATSKNQPRVSHSRIIDLLNLGLFNQKMMVNYVLTALVFSVSVFLPHFLFSLTKESTLIFQMLPISICVLLTIFEFLIVVVCAIVRHIRPFFTQGWVLFLQFLAWFIAMIAMTL